MISQTVILFWLLPFDLGVEGFLSSPKYPLFHVPSAGTRYASPTRSILPPHFMASYEVDSDEEAEQRLGQTAVSNGAGSVATATDIKTTQEAPNGDSSNNNNINKGRYDNLLVELGLQGQLRHVAELPSKRQVSCYDVFCNRELKQGQLAAVGFDMDYTLAQYKQPAFDKLAFDGAKQKLVYKLGYPKEVLDFEYDHEVRTMHLFVMDDAFGAHVFPTHLDCLAFVFSCCTLALDTRIDY